MITEEMSNTIESLLHQVASAPEEERTEIVLYLSTYLMHHAGMLLSFSADEGTAQMYSDLTRQMESVMHSIRKKPKPRNSLTLVKG